MGINYPMIYHNILKDILLNYWYITFNQLFTLKMNEFFDILNECLFIRKEERNRIHFFFVN